MEYKLKPISQGGVSEAVAKAELYRNLNQPEEAESICRDILALEPDHQLALRLLGLALTDQFTGGLEDRYAEAETSFGRLADPYEQIYYSGILHQRRAKAQGQAGRPPHLLRVLLERAMQCFEEAEKIRPPGNDDAILHWNRCLRLMESLPQAGEPAWEALSAGDDPPV